MIKVFNVVFIYMEFLDVIDAPSCDKFNALVKTKPTLAQFFSPGCGYCKELEPEWDSMRQMLEKKYIGDILLARIHADMMENVECHKKIEGFPTIFVLVNGKKKKEFKGDRKAAVLLKFIEDNFSIEEVGQRGGRKMLRLTSRQHRKLLKTLKSLKRKAKRSRKRKKYCKCSRKRSCRGRRRRRTRRRKRRRRAFKR